MDLSGLSMARAPSFFYPAVLSSSTIFHGLLKQLLYLVRIFQGRQTRASGSYASAHIDAPAVTANMVPVPNILSMKPT
jgi:hypothetical protein